MFTSICVQAQLIFMPRLSTVKFTGYSFEMVPVDMADEPKEGVRPKMKLYQFPGYRSFPCVWLIYELGVADDVELVKLDSLNCKDSEEYKEYVRSVHPHGTIPALVIDGEGVIIESTAICLYLADYYGDMAPAPDKRKDYYDWSIYAGTTMDEILEVLYWQWAAPSPRGGPDPEGVEKMVAKYDICMKRLTKTLQGKQYICGDSLTVPDCIVGFNVSSLRQEKFNKGCLVKDYSEVQAYVDRLENRPAYKMAVEAENK